MSSLPLPKNKLNSIFAAVELEFLMCNNNVQKKMLNISESEHHRKYLALRGIMAKVIEGCRILHVKNFAIQARQIFVTGRVQCQYSYESNNRIYCR